MHHHFYALVLTSFGLLGTASVQGADLGLFEGQTDIAAPAKAGGAEFADQRYVVSGGGANMWFTNDSFHFVWKKVSGDMSLGADVAFPSPGGNAHRKACLVIRQSLDPDSVYADVALHGDGLTSLQFREAKGTTTHEVQSKDSGPKRLRIEKRGKYVSMSVAKEGEPLQSSGASARVEFTEPYYIGLGVCAHDDNALEKAVFSKVELAPSIPAPEKGIRSTLEIIPLGSRDRRVVYTTTNLIEAPNWTRDSNFIFNSKGRIYRMPVTGGQPQMIDTGDVSSCNNDHGFSPDGTLLAVSSEKPSGTSMVYILPITGGAPKRITALGPSYWHGWSPDGKTLAYCGARNGEYDVYTIPVTGGEETRLTTAKGLDDGPEYSPDGQFIYFNSDRTGLMQIWRMRPDGSQQEQVTSDEYNNWFAHPSPDGKWLVFLSFEKEVKGHPANQDVRLRIMPAKGGKIEVLCSLFGGQGTINVPSWSPDSKQLAFVSYHKVP